MAGGVVIIGAGHAAGAMAAALRQGGYAGAVTLIGEEPLPPYQRPPLSKAWLKGEASADDLLLRPAAFYAEKSIELKLSRKVVGIDRASATVTLDGGEHIPQAAVSVDTLRDALQRVAFQHRKTAELPGGIYPNGIFFRRQCYQSAESGRFTVVAEAVVVYEMLGH